MTLHVILNPNASNQQKTARGNDLKRTLRGIDFHFCPRAFDSHLWRVRELARSGERQTVLAVGGDGTVNRLLPYLADSPVVLGILPAGTANDLARSLKIPDQTDAAIHVVRAGVTTQIDLLEVNGRKFVTSGGIGLAAEAARRANHWRKTPGVLRWLIRILGNGVYPLAAATLLSRNHGSVWVSIHKTDEAQSIRGLTVLFCNLQRLGRLFVPAPAACPRDGLLDLCVVHEPETLLGSCRVLFQSVFGDMNRLPGIQREQTRRVFLRSQKPLAFFGDGEILTENLEFALRVLPRALTVHVPKLERAA